MRQVSKIIIVNHWKREAEGKVLQRIIESKSGPLGIEVERSFDDGSLNIWGNYKQALTIPAKEDERFRLVLQDDITLSRKAIEKAIHILSFFPNNCFVSFYAPTNKGYQELKESGKRIMKTHSNFACLFFAFGTAIIKDFLLWNKNNMKAEYRYEDRRILAYSKANDVPIYCLQPSLCQHLGAYRSTMGFAGKIGKNIRYSSSFDYDAPVFGIDWTDEIKNAIKKEIGGSYLRQIHENTLNND